MTTSAGNTAGPTPADNEHGAILTIALATSVVLWAVAYAGLAPAIDAPEWLMLTLVGLGLLVAGTQAGRLTARGPSAGVHLGATIGLINAVILGALHGSESNSEAVKAGVMWIVGGLIVAMALCSIGAAIGSAWRAEPAGRPAWTSRLTVVAALTTFPLLVSGGIVTGLEEGMAVPDWLTTFRYPMFFYPMSLMQDDAGVYVEHFHRLWGLLVGITTITLVAHLIRIRAGGRFIAFAVAILFAVIAQGILGGTRVLENSIAFAIGHGIFAQCVFAAIVLLAAITSLRWRAVTPRPADTRMDHGASLLLVALLVAQLCLGALYRHLNAHEGVNANLIHLVLTMHITGAIIVSSVIFAVGVRGWNEHRREPVIPVVSMAMMIVVGVQLLFGIAATVAILYRGDGARIPAFEVAITTMHQATGAALLAGAVLLAAWIRRVFTWPASSVAIDERSAANATKA